MVQTKIYSFRSYKMFYSTLSHICTFVSPWQPLRRQSPVEIATRWRCTLPQCAYPFSREGGISIFGGIKGFKLFQEEQASESCH